MAATCGPATFICVFILLLVAASLAIAGEESEARASDDITLMRSLRSVTGQRLGGGRRGNEGVAVDGTIQNGRRGGSGRNGTRGNGGGRPGRGRGQGRGRGRGQGSSMFNRRTSQLIDRLADANTQFSMALYSRLAGENPDLIFSPHSIHTALTMTYLGAREQTARQMLQVLKLTRLRQQQAHIAYAALTNSLVGNEGKVKLNVANAVYVKPNLPIEDSFRTGLQDIYKAAFDHFDFEAEGGPEAPINDWVSTQTAGMIRDLLSQGTITPLTAMVIVNAIYFKGNWRYKFHESATTEQPFYHSAVAPIQVPMMTRTDTYNYTESDALQSHVVELPYQGDRFSMFVVVPTTRNALARVEETMTLEALTSALDAVTPMLVQLYLPRFRTESKFSLKETMQAMGMTNPFDPAKANFTGICSASDLYIFDVIHQAVVEVTEEGTEAAGATEVISYRSDYTVDVRADHPFLYLIRDNLTKAILFIGKYSGQQ